MGGKSERKLYRSPPPPITPVPIFDRVYRTFMERGDVQYFDYWQNTILKYPGGEDNSS